MPDPVHVKIQPEIVEQLRDWSVPVQVRIVSPPDADGGVEMEVRNLYEHPTNAEPIKVGYRNHRGDYAERNIVPRRVWYGSTVWHPRTQWLLDCWDVDKAAYRTFALADCDFDVTL